MAEAASDPNKNILTDVALLQEPVAQPTHIAKKF
jgi:hypothetical protein